MLTTKQLNANDMKNFRTFVATCNFRVQITLLTVQKTVQLVLDSNEVPNSDLV